MPIRAVRLVPVVAAALVDAGGRCLWQRRAPGVEAGGLWELPGGRVEPGELPADAIARELHEELGIDLSADAVGPPLAVSVTRSTAGRMIGLMLFRINRWIGTPRPRLGQPLLWAEPDRIDPGAMPAADRPFVSVLRRRLPAPDRG